MSPYHGRSAVLATRHGKERVIAPAFAAILGVDVLVPAGLDTDALGTFTGEIPRPASMLETARLKARMGMAAANHPLGIASEGSFGPHPAIPFLAAGRELMIFIDDTRGVEVMEDSVSMKTNFAALDVTPDADLDGFLARTGFPEHAVILRDSGRIIKGISSRDELERELGRCRGNVRIETEMRAHLNPTRMEDISRLADRLARRIATPCPTCAAPGFGISGSDSGLPCRDCATPTTLVRHVIARCALCGHEQRQPRADGRKAAAPAECPECNP